MKPTIESTWHTPCGQLFPEECRQVELQRWLEKRHNCKIPMFMTGNHLSLNESLPNCPEEVVLEASKKLAEPNENCPDTVPCSTSKYKIVFSDWTQKKLNSEKVENLIIRMDNHVEEFKVSPSYEFDNFMSDIGGIMGVFLGWSFLFFVVSFLKLIKNDRMKWWIEFALTIVLVFALIGWGWDTVHNYVNQSDSMEILVEKGWHPPQITGFRTFQPQSQKKLFNPDFSNMNFLTVNI